MFAELALLLLTQLAVSREEALLMIIRLFSTDEQIPQTIHVNEYTDDLLLQGKPDTILPQHAALYSTVRNRGSLRIHCMLRLLVR